MGLGWGIAIFFIVWWIVWFTVLPWGWRAPSQEVPGAPRSAPDNPRLGLKFLITTAITAVLWVGTEVVLYLLSP